jgi:hypothetical protein
MSQKCCSVQQKQAFRNNEPEKLEKVVEFWDPQRQALLEVTSPGWSLPNVEGWSLPNVELCSYTNHTEYKS